MTYLMEIIQDAHDFYDYTLTIMSYLYNYVITSIILTQALNGMISTSSL